MKHTAMKKTLWIPIIWLAFFVLSGCRAAGEEPAATPGLNATQAYQTVIARVTEVAALTDTPPGPTTTPPPTDSGLPTLTPTPPPPSTPTIAPPTATSPPTQTPIPCDLALPGDPIDVTIPDDTEVLPGAVFTKTWRLVNHGTCTWTDEYAAVWVSGERMNAADAVPLPGSVAPGESVDVTLVLTAPTDPGTYQGNWMLRNAQGELFGIGPEGNGVFWVRIVVPDSLPTPTATLPITTTPEPAVQVSGAALLSPGALLDLDSLTIGGAGDLSYQTAGDGTHPLTPQAGVRIGVFGVQQPFYSDCQNASMSAAPLAVESLPVGTYLCYQTDQGRFGWLRIDALDTYDFTLNLTILTWALAAGP